MPRVRCWFYSESGEPLRGGCRKRGTGCNFIHPGEPDWNNAPPPSTRGKDRGGGGSAGLKHWGERGKYSGIATSARDTPSAIDASGWDTGGGWGTAGSSSTANPVSDPWLSGNSSNSWNTSVPTTGWNPADTASGNVKSNGSGRGNGADAASGSGWGSSWNTGWGGDGDKSGSGWGSNENVGWGESGWGDGGKEGSGWGGNENSGWGGGATKEADKSTGSGWGNIHEGTWGEDQGSAKNTDKVTGTGWGSAQDGGSGGSWGNKEDATSSWGSFDAMIVVEKETRQNRGKAKAVPPPPRIRIPDSENKKTRITGTNSEPLVSNKWGSNIPTTSTATASTPVATLTPTDSTRVKRKRDAAFDDKMDVFKEYIKTWERGVRTRVELAEAEAKRNRWFRTQKSLCYARIGEAGRKKLDDQRAECDKEVNFQREKLSTAITSLAEFHNTITSQLDLGQRYNVGEETKKFVAESKSFVDKVRTLLVAHVLKDGNDLQSGDTQKYSSGVDSTLVNSLQHRVLELGDRFEQAQTELTLCHQRDIKSEIDKLLATKMTGLRGERQCKDNYVRLQSCHEIVIPPFETTEKAAQQIVALHARIPCTVQDIAALLGQVDATTKRVSKLEEELTANKEAYEKQTQKMAAEKEETERRVDERLEKIRAQFEQLVASQPPDPAAQADLSLDSENSRNKLIENLRLAFEADLDQFYKREVQPTIELMQQAIVAASDRQHQEAIKVLWGKMQPAMNMVTGVSRWLDSQELQATAPVDGR